MSHTIGFERNDKWISLLIYLVRNRWVFGKFEFYEALQMFKKNDSIIDNFNKYSLE